MPLSRAGAVGAREEAANVCCAIGCSWLLERPRPSLAHYVTVTASPRTGRPPPEGTKVAFAPRESLRHVDLRPHDAPAACQSLTKEAMPRPLEEEDLLRPD